MSIWQTGRLVLINGIGERLNLIIRIAIWLVSSLLLPVTHAIGKEEIKIVTKR